MLRWSRNRAREGLSTVEKIWWRRREQGRDSQPKEGSQEARACGPARSAPSAGYSLKGSRGSHRQRLRAGAEGRGRGQEQRAGAELIIRRIWGSFVT